jgi:hypothetical protein
MQVAVVVLVAGLFTLLIGGLASTIAWSRYSHVATLTPEPRTAASLAVDPTWSDHILRVDITPQATTGLRVRGDEWALFTVAEAEDVVFLEPGGPPPTETRTVLVERDTRMLVPACEFRTRYMSATTPMYRVHDPRPQAARDASLAGWTAVVGWPSGLAISLVGFLLIRFKARGYALAPAGRDRT